MTDKQLSTIEKEAFVFDTNFIIQNRNPNGALDKSKEKSSVYITQASIDERITQMLEFLLNLETFRAEIEETVEGSRGVYWENYFEDSKWPQTFTASTPLIKTI